MKRIYYPYHLWEDFQNGLYITKVDNHEYLISKSIELLSNAELFHEIGFKMISNWTISAAVNLTNLEQNRKSWLGQASCCYYAKCPEFITCEAWMMLTDKQRKLANNVANKLIKDYERTINNTEQILLEL